MRSAIYPQTIREKGTVLLFWPTSFRAKNHNEEHTPSCPSIRKMSHFVRSRRELNNCPVVNWEVFRKRRLERKGGNGVYLWERSQAGMCALFRVLVLESLRMAEHNTEVEVRPHQVKKLSISLCGKYWPRAKELNLEGFTGNKSYATLERYYIKKAPRLKLSCSLPLGTAPP